MAQSKTVLITGASGLVGARLTEMLLAKGYAVRHLGRKRKKEDSVETFTWDIRKGAIEKEALSNVDAIVHLAGASVAEKKWTSERKKEIIDSRVQSAQLIFETLKNIPVRPASFISASAVGYYGTDNGSHLFVESDPSGDDFLSEVTRVWEQSADRFSEIGLRVVKIRIGVVLSDKGGALQPMAKTVKAFIGSPLGSGKQYMSWIHIDDLCQTFIDAIDNDSMAGAYNCVAPGPVTNKEFMEGVGKALKRPVMFPRVPPFVLKMLLGEMSTIVLDGARVSSQKLQRTGFRFKFPTLEGALGNLLNRS
jgi:uncharacterized protein